MSENRKKSGFPRSTSSLRIRETVKKLKSMTMEEHLQLMVKAGLMTQEEADRINRIRAEKA